jgi:hypothetical protein
MVTLTFLALANAWGWSMIGEKWSGHWAERWTPAGFSKKIMRKQ